METIFYFIRSLKDKPCTYRLKIKNDPLTKEWSNWLIQPSENYIEAKRQGPYAINEIEWIYKIMYCV